MEGTQGKPDSQSRDDPFGEFLKGLERQGERLLYKAYAARSAWELNPLKADAYAFGLAVDKCKRAFEAAKRKAETGEYMEGGGI